MEPLGQASAFPCHSSDSGNQVQVADHAAANLLQRAPDLMLCDGASAGFDWAALLQHLQPPQAAAVAAAASGASPLVENLLQGPADDDGRKEKEKGKGKAKRGKKVSRPRFAFRTKSPNDILDDGYRWRKYGQKAVKDSSHPRSYYRCTHHTCNVKKQVQRLSRDTSIVVTTYEGVHNHPCEKLMEALAPILKQLQFLASI